MTKVYCEHCGRFLFETDIPETNRGRIAYEAMHKGYVAKLPVFFGVEHFIFFCDKKCPKEWMELHSTPEQREKARVTIGSLKETIESESFKKGLQDGLNKIQEVAKYIKSLKKTNG